MVFPPPKAAETPQTRILQFCMLLRTAWQGAGRPVALNVMSGKTNLKCFEFDHTGCFRDHRGSSCSSVLISAMQENFNTKIAYVKWVAISWCILIINCWYYDNSSPISESPST